MHTYIHRQNQQVNRRHIKITYLLTTPEPTRGESLVSRMSVVFGPENWSVIKKSLY